MVDTGRAYDSTYAAFHTYTHARIHTHTHSTHIYLQQNCPERPFPSAGHSPIKATVQTPPFHPLLGTAVFKFLYYGHFFSYDHEVSIALVVV